MPDETPKLCPWCGETTVATWESEHAEGEENKVHFVECLSCCAAGPWSSTKEEAITAWDRINLDPIKED